MQAKAENKITIYGPKNDGTYLVEFRSADGQSLAIWAGKELIRAKSVGERAMSRRATSSISANIFPVYWSRRRGRHSTDLNKPRWRRV
jgi:hypothetical protein